MGPTEGVEQREDRIWRQDLAIAVGLGGQPTERGHQRKQGRGWQPSGGGKGHSHTQQVRSTFPTHFPEYSHPQRVPPALIPILQRSKLRLLPKPHCQQENGEASVLHKWRYSTHPRGGETVLRLPGTRPSLPCGCLSPTSLQASRQALLNPTCHPASLPQAPTYSSSNTCEMRSSLTCAPS